ncbi:unnamed protein product [Ectocarpus sp. CCAP 1310/34]|nr:unnamed protein product [Ectocarpus sp. CCAP 1310/34]
MVIEAGSSAINLLEPMEEEIKCIDKTAGARYQFKLDRRVLSPVQLAAITRIYGDHGAEILELLRKNPCKTVPVILARLRQKDVEWRVSRERLNKLWSNVQRSTYYKSLDRRSIDLKNEDKKAHSARVLVADITHRRAALLAKEEEPKPLDRAALADAADAAAKEAAKASNSSSCGGDEDDDVTGKGKGKKDDDMDTDDNEAGSKEGKGTGGGDGDKGKAAAAEEIKDESNQEGTNDASSSSSPVKQQQKVKAEIQNGDGKAGEEGEEGARQAAVDKMVADHEAQVMAAKQAKAERERMESSAPHFMQTHLALSYPPSTVRRDMHQLLLHAVRHSSNTPSDKNKMLKALPSLRAWMGGSLSWEDMTAGHNVSKVYSGAGVRGVGTPGSGVGDLKAGWMVLLRRGEARVTAVKKGPAPADAPPTVPGGNPADVVVEVEATMMSGGASVTAKAGEILQVRPEGVGVMPPSPLTEDSDSPRSTTGKDAAGAWSGGGGARGAEAGPVLPESERVLLCTQELYVLMRIHHVLCDRLGKAVKLAEDAKALKAGQKDHPQNPIIRESCETDEEKLMRSLGLGGGDSPLAFSLAPPPSSDGKGGGLRGYSGFLALLYAFTDQSNSELKLEDAVQLTVGNEAYMLFSYDKVINAFLRQLKLVVDDDSSLKMLQLFEHQAALGAFQPARLLSECRKVLKSKVDNLFRLQWSTAPSSSSSSSPSTAGEDEGASLLIELVVPNSTCSGSSSSGTGATLAVPETSRSASPTAEAPGKGNADASAAVGGTTAESERASTGGSSSGAGTGDKGSASAASGDASATASSSGGGGSASTEKASTPVQELAAAAAMDADVRPAASDAAPAEGVDKAAGGKGGGGAAKAGEAAVAQEVVRLGKRGPSSSDAEGGGDANGNADGGGGEADKDKASSEERAKKRRKEEA